MIGFLLGRCAAIGLVVALTVLACASPAAAEPQGIFKVFNQCPTEIPGVELCSSARITSGAFSIGSVEIPVDKTLVLQIGDIPTGNPEYPETEFFGVPAKDGESLSKAELDVPGGLFGSRVTATPELVASRKNQLTFNEFAFTRAEGTALSVPLRLHLKNLFLGSSCYIGSEASPLQLHLTTGETHPPKEFKPLHGTNGQEGILEEKELAMFHVTGDSLVDNTFAAPGAEGCGEVSSGKGSLDQVVDEKLKIPDAAGENTAVLGGELNSGSPAAAIASENWVPSFAPPVPGGLPASSVTQLTATLNGTLKTSEAPVDYHFEYGTTTAYGQIAPTPERYTPITSETLPVSQPVSNLQAATTYHYRLLASNPSGIRVVGPDETFTTLPIPAPTVQTGSASSVAVHTATLSGAVDPHGWDTTYLLQYGASTAYGQSSPTVPVDMGAAESPQPVVVGVSGLLPGTTYHYRLIASNSGGTSYGQDMTFTTGEPPAPMIQQPVELHPLVASSGKATEPPSKHTKKHKKSKKHTKHKTHRRQKH
jgi:hypothetical protein